MGSLIIFPLFLGIGALIGAVFLRAGVWLANMVFKPTPIAPQRSLDLPADFLDEDTAAGGNDLPADFLGKDPVASGNPFAKPTGAASINSATDSNPYAAPQSYGSPAKAPKGKGKATAIPEPNYGKACGIVLVQIFASLFIGILVGLVPMPQFPAQLCGFVIWFVVATLIYSAMLPTTLGRAAVVYLFQLLASFVVAFGAAMVVMALLTIFV